MATKWTTWICLLCPVVLSQPPHIITIFVDDLGWHDVGYHGTDQVKTPNIDALAYSGMILSRHYVLPTCTPSRTALLTGTYPIRTGMQGFPLKGGDSRSLPLKFKLKPAYLKNLGYKTHMVGKWHLGYQTFNHVPDKRGFDSFFGYYNGYVDYFNYRFIQNVYSNKTEELSQIFSGYDLHLNDNVYWSESIYGTRLFTKKAQDIIRNHNASEPLYLYFSHLAVHTGNDEAIGIQAPNDVNLTKNYHYIKDEGRRCFASALEELDKSVGNIMKALNSKGMLENSIVMFLSDNGAHTVSVDMAPNWSSNWPLAGSKFTMFEGGVRGAALIWSPLLPKGLINEGFMHISDWLPTLYAAAGGNIKDLGAIDGTNQWEALKNVKSVKKENILLNIDEKADIEGIIINDRWKVLKGGFSGYGNYELHWGKEENVKPNPEYNLTDVINSEAGKIIQKLPNYRAIFEAKRIKKLREKSTVKCKVPEPKVSFENGYVPISNDLRCSDYCIFDIVNDPCELEKVVNDEVLKISMEYLKKYREGLVPQEKSFVDLRSNPENFGDVWMPWDNGGYGNSVAKDFTNQYLNVSLILTLSWYFFRRKHSRS